jgi:hypothetical protein
MGRVAHRAQQIACISVQEARRASTLQHRRVQCSGCGGGGRMACLFSLSRLVCDRYSMHMLRARCARGERVQ